MDFFDKSTHTFNHPDKCPLGLSHRDFQVNSMVLLIKWGRALGFHYIEYEHQKSCPYDPDHINGSQSTYCMCQPDGVLVENPGKPAERRILVFRDLREVNLHLVPRSPATVEGASR